MDVGKPDKTGPPMGYFRVAGNSPRNSSMIELAILHEMRPVSAGA
jgi:hypothetical protein